jgi:hypothetical protein
VHHSPPSGSRHSHTSAQFVPLRFLCTFGDGGRTAKADWTKTPGIGSASIARRTGHGRLHRFLPELSGMRRPRFRQIASSIPWNTHQVEADSGNVQLACS